ncbi:MAG: TIGR00296 family protein [Thermoprotei archaeon]|nr:MAG: TIGR00296 family protein [Thermoprotei archaeon]
MVKGLKLFRPLTLEEGKYLVKLARAAVTEYLSFGRVIEPRDAPSKLRNERFGVFVTIEKIVQGKDGIFFRSLRGRVGFPEANCPLTHSTILAAIYAATEDPRFQPLTLSELKDVVFEVSVLSKPSLLQVSSPLEYLENIVLGVHGVLVEKNSRRGIVLPQVAIQYEWDVETLLSEACTRAGLPPSAWKGGDVKVYVFQAQIFYELEPEGEVIERMVYLNPIVKKKYPELVSEICRQVGIEVMT